MKLIVLIFLTTSITACQDPSLRRQLPCIDDAGRSIVCNVSTEVEADDFNRKYIAEVTVPTIVGQKELIFKESVGDRDLEDENNECSLHISAGALYKYSIIEDTLTLKNELATIELTKTNGHAEEGLIGTWSMEENSPEGQIITEIIFEDLEEIRFRKTCNLK